jgi:hypothetical protein
MFITSSAVKAAGTIYSGPETSLATLFLGSWHYGINLSNRKRKTRSIWISVCTNDKRQIRPIKTPTLASQKDEKFVARIASLKFQRMSL